MDLGGYCYPSKRAKSSDSVRSAGPASLVASEEQSMALPIYGEHRSDHHGVPTNTILVFVRLYVELSLNYPAELSGFMDFHAGYIDLYVGYMDL